MRTADRYTIERSLWLDDKSFCHTKWKMFFLTHCALNFHIRLCWCTAREWTDVRKGNKPAANKAEKTIFFHGYFHALRKFFEKCFLANAIHRFVCSMLDCGEQLRNAFNDYLRWNKVFKEAAPCSYRMTWKPIKCLEVAIRFYFQWHDVIFVKHKINWALKWKIFQSSNWLENWKIVTWIELLYSFINNWKSTCTTGLQISKVNSFRTSLKWV